MNNISISIITKDEERNIERLLASCEGFKDIVVIDSGSNDQTVEIANALGATCLEMQWMGFGLQKQLAVEACQYDWVLSLDADEELSSELLTAISRLELSDPSTAFEFKRKSYFLGRPVNFSGWQNDCVVRLFNRTTSNFSDQLVHEKIIGYNKKIRVNDGCIYHHSYQSEDDVNRKTDLYGSLGAEELARNRRTPYSSLMIAAKSVFAFFRTFILRLGILDGPTGLRISLMNAKVTYGKYQKFNKLVCR